MVEIKPIVETKANPKKNPRQFDELLEWILRYELGVVLDENRSRQAFHFEGDFALPDLDYIVREIALKLAHHHHLYPDEKQIKSYFKSISSAIEAMLKNGIDYDAKCYASASYRKKAELIATEKEAKINKTPNPLPLKPMGRPRKEKPKREHKRRFLHPDGKIYTSIAQAAQANHESYSALRKHAWRQMQKAKKTLGTNGDNFI